MHPWNTNGHEHQIPPPTDKITPFSGPPGTTDEHEHGRHDKGPKTAKIDTIRQPTTTNTTTAQQPRKTHCKTFRIFVPKHYTIMALINKRLTPGEIAAVYYHVYGGVDDWVQLYAIADGIKDKQVYDINRNTVSKWKSMTKITGLIAQLKAQRARTESGTDKKNEDDNESREKRPILKNSKLVDYSSPAAQREKLNELVNTADDPGEALDALKVIIQSQRADREAAKDGKVVRAYLPITCAGCPLYKLQVKKRSKEL